MTIPPTTPEQRSVRPAAVALRPDHFGISVPDLDATIRWYTDVLGFSVEHGYEIPALAAKAAFLTLDGFRVEVFEVSGASPMPATEGDPATGLAVHGLKHMTFAVEDLDAAMAALMARGVVFVAGPREVPGTGGARFAFFRDNSGILLELYQHTVVESS